ncbi:MAG TPA: halocarboxylic acid dehydrogenase DehI family protein [Terriglobales bacterium]|nr:halocarboxylic acid dehydrogenase DehI family protein [Terriglobales bacterium]
MPWKKGQRPKFVREQEATGEIAAVYREIREDLGLPMVPAPYLVLAAYPHFLQLHWHAMRPLVQTQEFFHLADRLRADAYTRVHNYFKLPDLCRHIESLRFSSGARQELTDTVELFQYKDSLLLLLLATQLQAFDKTVGKGGGGTVPAEHPVFTERPCYVEEDRAPAPMRKLYDDIKRTTGLPFVTTDHLILARWPDFLTAYWQMLKPLTQSPIYSETQWKLRDTTWEMTTELPVRIELTCERLTDEGMADDDVASCVRITELFTRHLSGMVLNVAAAKIALEGGTLTDRDEPEEIPSAA